MTVVALRGLDAGGQLGQLPVSCSVMQGLERIICLKPNGPSLKRTALSFTRAIVVATVAMPSDTDDKP